MTSFRYTHCLVETATKEKLCWKMPNHEIIITGNAKCVKNDFFPTLVAKVVDPLIDNIEKTGHVDSVKPKSESS